jgi:hypothetical protein
VYNFNVPTFGKGVVYDVDQKVRTEQFRFFTEALKKDRLKKYVPQFAAEAEVSGNPRVAKQRGMPRGEGWMEGGGATGVMGGGTFASASAPGLLQQQQAQAVLKGTAV